MNFMNRFALTPLRTANELESFEAQRNGVRVLTPSAHADMRGERYTTSVVDNSNLVATTVSDAAFSTISMVERAFPGTRRHQFYSSYTHLNLLAIPSETFEKIRTAALKYSEAGLVEGIFDTIATLLDESGAAAVYECLNRDVFYLIRANSIVDDAGKPITAEWTGSNNLRIAHQNPALNRAVYKAFRGLFVDTGSLVDPQQIFSAIPRVVSAGYEIVGVTLPENGTELTQEEAVNFAKEVVRHNTITARLRGFIYTQFFTAEEFINVMSPDAQTQAPEQLRGIMQQTVDSTVNGVRNHMALAPKEAQPLLPAPTHLIIEGAYSAIIGSNESLDLLDPELVSLNSQYAKELPAEDEKTEA